MLFMTEFIATVLVSGIQTQGDGDDGWVTNFTLKYQVPKQDLMWRDVLTSYGITKVGKIYT